MRNYLISGVILLVLLIMLNQVSAISPEELMYNLKDSLSNLLNIAITSYENNNDVFFIRILLMIIIYVVTHTAVKAIPKIGENSIVTIIISGAVSILAMKGMSDELVTMILLPYGSMGIALATILPFLIFFYFVHATKMGGIGRRFSWLLFAISFGAIFYNRYNELTETGKYFYLACVGLIMIALVFDKAIHHYFFLHELSVFYKGANQKTIASLQGEYLNIVHVDTPEANARKDKIKAQLKELGSDLP